jgi:bifunctional DNA-binding transcriptional regulator/antitoxin component of YhaV-PrlF toxin-antitoxin module
MRTHSQVSERGQITIDRDIRRKLGIQPGMIAVQRIVNGKLEIVFVPGPHTRSLFGILHDPNAPPYPQTSDELEQAVIEAIAAEAEEHDGSSRG